MARGGLGTTCRYLASVGGGVAHRNHRLIGGGTDKDSMGKYEEHGYYLQF